MNDLLKTPEFLVAPLALVTISMLAARCLWSNAISPLSYAVIDGPFIITALIVIFIKCKAEESLIRRTATGKTLLGMAMTAVVIMYLTRCNGISAEHCCFLVITIFAAVWTTVWCM